MTSSDRVIHCRRHSVSPARRTGFVAISLVALAAALAAQTGGPFRYERAVITSGPGPQRLAIDVELLDGSEPPTVTGGIARNGFSDLRLFDQSGAPVPHLLISAPPDALRQPLTAPLTFTRRPSEPGVSRYRLVLPGPRLPITAIELAVRTGHVFRAAAVSESRIAGGEAAPAELGRAQLQRIEQDGVAAGDLQIPIASPAEVELDLVIADGSNPPLDLESVHARFAALPWIYFEAPAGPVSARYGNPAATSPAFDLEAVRYSIDVGALPSAAWGSVRPISPPITDPPASLPAPGAALDPGSFRHTREIDAGGSGLVALVLDAAALAHSRGPEGRFADVRVLDAAGHQLPYLVERRDEPLPLDLAIRQEASAVPPAGRQRSTYRVTLPYAGLPDGRLVLETSARVFRRQVQVAIERPPDRRNRTAWLDRLAASEWTHASADAAAPALVLTLTRLDARELVITVDEGDNAALPITSARLLVPSYRLRFYRPGGGTLRLVYGRDDLTPPQYDLALLAPQVMGGEVTETAAAAAAADAADPEPAFISPRVFWGLLGGAVIALLVLIGRLVARPAK